MSINISDPISDKTHENLAVYPRLTRILLANRGITEAEKAHEFLNPDYNRDTHDPFLIKDMDKAVKRILKAIEKKEKIIVYSDYDHDGIPGGVILHDFFKKIGYVNFQNYIPHRHKEGYSLNIPAIDGFAKDGATLLITVDCGITDVEEVVHAQSLGIDVIITDHHLPASSSQDGPASSSQDGPASPDTPASPNRGESQGGPNGKLPPAYAILNSKQDGDTYPDNMLCGAGVAWKLVQALLVKNGKGWNVQEGWEKWLLDMAGLATLSDMVPLVDENRVLAYFGLKVLRKSPRPGLLKLLRKMRMEQAHITEDDVGFMISPRINAASRMDVPMEAFNMLATNDEAVAEEVSDHLHNMNDKRKLLVASIMKGIKSVLAQRKERSVIVVGNPDWSVGVLGIAANKLLEKYGKPVFVWGRKGSPEIKGSCRSDGSVDLVELMAATPKDFFLDSGGHELSGGFSISHENIHLMEEEINKSYEKTKKDSFDRNGIIMVDEKLSLEDVNEEVYMQIEKLAPFGIGNSKPTFLFENIKITKIEVFGKRKEHLKLIFENLVGEKITAIGFFTTTHSFAGKPIEDGKTINLVATFDKSHFRGRPELRLRIVDII